MEGSGAASWRKSSYSGNNGGNCVEAGSVPGAVFVRDSTNPDGGRLGFSARVWREFAARIIKCGNAG